MAAPTVHNPSNTSKGIVWPLQGYARFVPKGNQDGSEHGPDKNQQNVSGKWKYFTTSDGPVTLSLQEGHHLLVCQGSTVLESYFLRNASETMKAYTKTDSILFVQKFKNETRRFRVKFDAAGGLKPDEKCAQCVKELSAFLHVKNVNEENTESRNGQGTSDRTQLSGEVPLSEISKVLTHDLPADLPAAYRHSNTQVSPDDSRTLIRLCLTDPAFPGFVESVEKELKELTSDN